MKLRKTTAASLFLPGLFNRDSYVHGECDGMDKINAAQSHAASAKWLFTLADFSPITPRSYFKQSIVYEKLTMKKDLKVPNLQPLSF